MTPQEAKQASLIATFVESGMHRDEAAIWSGFATTALQVVQIAYKRVRRPNKWNALIAAGRPDEAIGEVDISLALYHEIDALMDDAPASSKLHALEFTVEPPAMDPHRRGRRTRRGDFRVKRRWGSGVVKSLAVEAKLLRQNSDVRKHYLGASGMGCFRTTDSPYTRERVALMFAYSTSRENPPWANLIDTTLRSGGYDATMHEVTARFGIELHSSVLRPMLGLPPLSILHVVFAFPPG